jgi:hypothetical protein
MELAVAMQPHWAQKGADRATEQSSVLSLSERSIRLVPLTPVPRQRMGYAKKNLRDVEVVALDAVRVSPGVARSFEAGEDGLEVLIVGPHVESDGEMVEGFWNQDG